MQGKLEATGLRSESRNRRANDAGKPEALTYVRGSEVPSSSLKPRDSSLKPASSLLRLLQPFIEHPADFGQR